MDSRKITVAIMAILTLLLGVVAVIIGLQLQSSQSPDSFVSDELPGGAGSGGTSSTGTSTGSTLCPYDCRPLSQCGSTNLGLGYGDCGALAGEYCCTAPTGSTGTSSTTGESTTGTSGTTTGGTTTGTSTTGSSTTGGTTTGTSGTTTGGNATTSTSSTTTGTTTTGSKTTTGPIPTTIGPLEFPLCGSRCSSDSQCPADNQCVFGTCRLSICVANPASCSADGCTHIPQTALISDEVDRVLVAFSALIIGLALFKYRVIDRFGGQLQLLFERTDADQVNVEIKKRKKYKSKGYEKKLKEKFDS